MNVSFIGAGNLAWHLAPVLDNTDFAVREVYSRDSKNAATLVEKLYEARVKTDLDFTNSASKIFILAVTDDAISELVERLQLPDNAFLIHTSGSRGLSTLGYASTPNVGVFYPLQTFTKGRKVDFKDIPIFIESENSATEKILLQLGKAISRKVLKISSTQRKALHVAAVFASNFTNYMLTLSQEIILENKLDFDLLKPLIVETINKSLSIGPDKAQTGPAKRADLEILDKHLEFLQSDEGVAEIYRIISQNIVDRYHND